MSRRSTPSRYSRYPRYISKGLKYQFVPFSIDANFEGSGRMNQVLVPQSSVQGIRKVKNFAFSITTSAEIPMLWALVYLPEGGAINTINPQVNTGAPITGTPEGGNPRATFVELFAANQWVIACGTCISGAVQNYRTRMARNLNGGDSVWFICWTAQGTPAGFVNITGNYAIRYN